MIRFVQTPKGVSIYLGNDTLIVSKTHENFQAVINALADDKTTEEQVRELADLKKSVDLWSKGELKVGDDDVVTYKARGLSPKLTSRILKLVKEVSAKPDNAKTLEILTAFLGNLFQNPSRTAVEGLYGFLEACDLPLTTDGFFLAYKKVRPDYGSIRATPEGIHLDNTPGKEVTMDRNLVDENPNNTCSTGLHVCSYNYLTHYGDSELDRVVVVKVNPRDVVAVPTDYSNQKMRTCGYNVIDEIPNNEGEVLTSWTYSAKPINWIRDTVEELKKAYAEAFKIKIADLEVNTALFGYGITDRQKNEFLIGLVKQFKLSTGLTDSSAEKIIEWGAKNTGFGNIRSILKWISNFAA